MRSGEVSSDTDLRGQPGSYLPSRSHTSDQTLLKLVTVMLIDTPKELAHTIDESIGSIFEGLVGSGTDTHVVVLVTQAGLVHLLDERNIKEGAEHVAITSINAD